MKKIKKFGRGGDILTALGAGLAGYGAYKALNKDKDKDEGKDRKDYLKDAIDRAPKQSDTPTADDTPKADDAGRQRAMAASKGRPEMGDATNDNIVVKEDAPTVKKDASDKKPRVIKKKKDEPKTEPPSKPYPKVTRNFVPNEERASIPYPEKEAAAKKRQNFLSSKAGLSGKGIPTPGDSSKKEATLEPSARTKNVIKAVQGTLDNRSKSMARTPEQKMSEGAREVQRRRDKEKAEKLGYGIKKGGMVKKYANGGSVKRSASSRADGIAIRGKTRA